MALSIEKKFSVDLGKPLNVQYGGGLMFTGDAGADTFEITLYKSGEAYAPGGSVALNCIRADGNTVTVTGSISGNVASATLTQACCAISGPLSVVMQIISGGNTGAVFAAAYTVMPAQTGNPIDPGTMIPDIAALIAQIDAAVGSIPADYSDLLAAIAPTFSTSTAYAAGDYVWYDGELYKFIAAHSAGTWTGSDAAAAVFATDIADLKSALNTVNVGDYALINIVDGETINAATGVISADSRGERTDYIPLSDFPLGLKIQNKYNANHYAEFYDSNKTFTGYVTLGANSTTVVTPPANSTYFILYTLKTTGRLAEKLVITGLTQQSYQYFSGKVDAVNDNIERLNVGRYVFTNIIDGETVTANTGVISADATCERTDYVSLDDFPLGLRIQNLYNGAAYAEFYNSSKVFTGYVTLTASATTSVTPPANSAYMILYTKKTTGRLNEKLIVFGMSQQTYLYFKRQIDGLILPTQKTYSCVSGSNVEPLCIFKNHTYRVINNSGNKISVSSCYANGTDIETFVSQFADGGNATYTATADADYIRIFLLATSGNVTVYDESGNIGNAVDGLKSDVTALQNIVQAKADRPASGYEDFSVEMNCHDYTEDAEDGEAFYTDYGVIALPTNYSPSANPTKLIILCGGNGERISSNTNPSTFHGWAYYLAKGYAVMDMNGMPSAWATAQGFPLSDKHLCNKYLIGSYKKGYEYVLQKYNIDPKQVFIAGISMGGGASALLVQSGIFPVVAHCMFCPALSVYKQDYMNPWNNETNQKKTIAGQWGFTDWSTTETFDQAYFLANIEKISGFDNLLIRAIGDFDTANAHYGDTDEANAYNAMKKSYPVPVKLWHCENDNTVYIRYSRFFVNMIKNAGGQAWLRTFATGGHLGGWGTGEVTDTDIDGETITTSIPFYESLLFFKRFG